MLRKLTLALATSLVLVVPAALAQKAGNGPVPKTLRYAFPVAETTFDPAQVTDLYSNTVLNGIFEGPLEYEFLAPGRIRPNTAVALPEISEDLRTFTFRIKPGIFFADDPAF